MRINEIWIEEEKNRVKLCANIKLEPNTIEKWKRNTRSIDKKIFDRYRTDYLSEGKKFTLWYSVPKKYEYALCPERSDAFVVACLYFAIIAEEDIECMKPLTKGLLYQINKVIIPAMNCQDNNLRPIRVFAEEAEEITKVEHFNGTGASCGVDSFSTILLHLEDSVPKGNRLTHLAVFNTGALGYDGYSKEISLKKWRKNTLPEYHGRIQSGSKVAEELGLDFIDVDSNLPEFYQGAFAFSHNLRNCSAVLATQKMWDNYYYASAGLGLILRPSLKEDAATADMLVLPNISTPTLHFYSCGASMPRIKKTIYISDNPIVQKYINVCAYETENCGHCVKCIRTMMALDIIGKLELFNVSFPHQEFYKKNRWKELGNVLDKNNKDLFMQELREYIIENSIDVGRKAKFYHILKPIRKIRVAIINAGRK